MPDSFQSRNVRGNPFPSSPRLAVAGASPVRGVFYFVNLGRQYVGRFFV